MDKRSGITSAATRKTGARDLAEDEEELLAVAAVHGSPAGGGDCGSALQALGEGAGEVAAGMEDLAAKGEGRAGTGWNPPATGWRAEQRGRDGGG
jgi:hypothetical protein